MLKSAYADRYEIGVTPEALSQLTHASRYLTRSSIAPRSARHPMSANRRFATKAGIHASAIIKDPRTYEHVPPEAVGNRRRLLVSDQGGKSNVLAVLDRLGIEVSPDDPRIPRLSGGREGA